MKASFPFTRYFIAIFCIVFSLQIFSQVLLEPLNLPNNPHIMIFKPFPPKIKSTSYILIDANSNKILAENRSEERREPASLTKMLTLYIVSKALKDGHLRLEDTTIVSKKAWRTGGTRTFLKEGQTVSIKDLIYGVIVQSGNDACIALVEHMSGNIESFVSRMNIVAQELGMKNSHFTDPTGLPDTNQFSTAKDMAILTQALIRDFPEQYSWYKEKWFTFNGIKQPNRNRLLWLLPYVDGVKTGHHNSGGYILSASGEKDGMRLIAITMQAPSEEARTLDSKNLLEYGFRFFETKLLYKSHQELGKTFVWYGNGTMAKIGLANDLYVTYPKGKYNDLSAHLLINKTTNAPVKKGEELGNLQIKLGSEVFQTHTLIALNDVPKGNIIKRSWDKVRYWLN